MSEAKVQNDLRFAANQYDKHNTIGKYKMVRQIGKGGFGQVWLAIHLPTNTNVAMKIVDKINTNKKNLQIIYGEVDIMQQLNHPNIVQLFEVMENSQKLFIIMEYLYGNVRKYLSKNGHMTEQNARIKFRQVLSALCYCHNKNICHRDLKDENLLLDENTNFKIADFGLACVGIPGQKFTSFVGSLPYAAPEIIQNQHYEGAVADVWSLGVVLYKLVVGTLPFKDKEKRILRRKIIEGTYELPQHLSQACRRLLGKMLVIEPKQRATVKDLIGDKWVNLNMETRLRLYVEPKSLIIDSRRVKIMIQLGYQISEINISLNRHSYDHVFGTYQILGWGKNKIKLNDPSYKFIPYIEGVDDIKYLLEQVAKTSYIDTYQKVNRFKAARILTQKTKISSDESEEGFYVTRQIKATGIAAAAFACGAIKIQKFIPFSRVQPGLTKK